MARTNLQRQLSQLKEAVEREVSRTRDAESDSEAPSVKAPTAGAGKKAK